MHLQSQRFLLLIALAFGLCQAGFAKNWVVQVGDTTGGGYYGGGTTPVLAFSPTPLTINAGDSVTFTNLGGAAHNIHADDDSFRCAAGCRGDGSGAMGDPDSSGWSDTITFSKPGTINYHCDQHVSMGMTGSIVVNAVAPLPFAIGGYISGNWYNPQQGGHGFQIIASNAIDTATNLPIMNAIWFVYTPDGSSQAWIYAQGDYDPTSNSVTLPAALLTGAKFPPNFVAGDVHKLNSTNWGTITLSFSDCNTGTASWHSDFAGYNAANDTPLSIVRLTQVAGTSCPQ